MKHSVLCIALVMRFIAYLVDHTPRRFFFDFIYVKLDVIGTCMQFFKKIDRKKNSKFFI